MAILNSSVPKANLNYAGAGDGPSLTRHVASYTDRRIVWYKGVENLLDITISGADRRPINLLNKEVVLTLWDRVTGTTFFRRRVINTAGENGQCKLTVFARDLTTIDSGIYQLSATIVDSAGLETALTWDRAKRADFDVEVKEAIVPASRITHEVLPGDYLVDGNGVKTSSAFNGPSYFRKDIALVTMAVHASNYTGTITLQGTLDQIVTSQTLWSDLKPQGATQAEIPFAGFTGIDPSNYYAGVRWLRLVIKDDASNAGTVDKIQLRV